MALDLNRYLRPYQPSKTTPVARSLQPSMQRYAQQQIEEARPKFSIWNPRTWGVGLQKIGRGIQKYWGPQAFKESAIARKEAFKGLGRKIAAGMAPSLVKDQPFYKRSPLSYTKLGIDKKDLPHMVGSLAGLEKKPGEELETVAQIAQLATIPFEVSGFGRALKGIYGLGKVGLKGLFKPAGGILGETKKKGFIGGLAKTGAALTSPWRTPLAKGIGAPITSTRTAGAISGIAKPFLGEETQRKMEEFQPQGKAWKAFEAAAPFVGEVPFSGTLGAATKLVKSPMKGTVVAIMDRAFSKALPKHFKAFNKSPNPQAKADLYSNVLRQVGEQSEKPTYDVFVRIFKNMIEGRGKTTGLTGAWSKLSASQAVSHMQQFRKFGPLGPDVMPPQLAGQLGKIKTAAGRLTALKSIGRKFPIKAGEFMEKAATRFGVVTPLPTGKLIKPSVGAKAVARMVSSGIGRFLTPQSQIGITTEIQRGINKAINSKFIPKEVKTIKAALEMAREGGGYLGGPRTLREMGWLRWGKFTDELNRAFKDMGKAKRISGKVQDIVYKSGIRSFTEGITTGVVDRLRAIGIPFPGGKIRLWNWLVGVSSEIRFTLRPTFHLQQIPEVVIFNKFRASELKGIEKIIADSAISKFGRNLFSKNVGRPPKEALGLIKGLATEELHRLPGYELGARLMANQVEFLPQLKRILEKMPYVKKLMKANGVKSVWELREYQKAVIGKLGNDADNIMGFVNKYLKKYKPSKRLTTGFQIPKGEVDRTLVFGVEQAWRSAMTKGMESYLYSPIRSGLEKTLHGGILFPISYIKKVISRTGRYIGKGHPLKGLGAAKVIKGVAPTEEEYEREQISRNLPYEDKWVIGEKKPKVGDRAKRWAKQLAYRVMDPFGLEWGTLSPGGPSPAWNLVIEYIKKGPTLDREGMMNIVDRYSRMISPAYKEFANAGKVLRDFLGKVDEEMEKLSPEEQEEFRKQIEKLPKLKPKKFQYDTPRKSTPYWMK